MATMYPDGTTAIKLVTPVFENVPCSNVFPALDKSATSPIARPYQCFVIGCDEPILRDNGIAREIDHKRFGKVHACDGHDPKGRDRY